MSSVSYHEERYVPVEFKNPKTTRHSGIFRVVQYRASTQADLREKTGMTVVSVVCNERRWGIFVAPQAPLLPGAVRTKSRCLDVGQYLQIALLSFLRLGSLCHSRLTSLQAVPGGGSIVSWFQWIYIT